MYLQIWESASSSPFRWSQCAYDTGKPDAPQAQHMPSGCRGTTCCAGPHGYPKPALPEGSASVSWMRGRPIRQIPGTLPACTEDCGLAQFPLEWSAYTSGFPVLRRIAMIFVVVEDLVPESHQECNVDLATMGVMLVFTVMMISDVALG